MLLVVKAGVHVKSGNIVYADSSDSIKAAM